MKVNTTSKLIRVYAHALPGGVRTRYVGYFEDGTVAPLRESNKDFVTCSQIAVPAYLGYPATIEYIFSSKLGHVGLNGTQLSRLMANVPIGLETSSLH
jgi:hypothetical protein